MPNIVYKTHENGSVSGSIPETESFFFFSFCIGLLPKSHSATRSKNGRWPRGAETVIVSLPA